VKPRLTFITLGVVDVSAARAFYERLGFKASSASRPSIAFFDVGGTFLSLYSREALANETRATGVGHGFSGVTLAHNVDTEAEVEAVIREAVAAGATLVKRAEKTYWGGYSGYFADPDGHNWEVAHNPFLEKDAEGRFVLPPSQP
jgi:hypothetical protein